ncbi:hypothetical protein J6TS1_26410 [Siminovitchia terrae]|uniref:Uncharacterized protein n=1 Tax=Siminovitchia terrae TaxID=1914933 RepID=A0ABQ4KXT7_SIMTE|nr:hypothetical protein J6TS1_26410 [Siminovitchia terrae]
MSSVKVNSVPGIESLHDIFWVVIYCFQLEMNVVKHEAIGMEYTRKLGADFFKYSKVSKTIPIIIEN